MFWFGAFTDSPHLYATWYIPCRYKTPVRTVREVSVAAKVVCAKKMRLNLTFWLLEYIAETWVNNVCIYLHDKINKLIKPSDHGRPSCSLRLRTHAQYAFADSWRRTVSARDTDQPAAGRRSRAVLQLLHMCWHLSCYGPLTTYPYIGSLSYVPRRISVWSVTCR